MGKPHLRNQASKTGERSVEVPLANLRAQYESIRTVIDRAMQAVVDRGTFIKGPFVEEFEQNFAKALGTRYAVGTSSGSSALHLALLAVGVGTGDEVITTPFTMIATTAAISQAGARIRFADIEDRTYNLDPSRAMAALGNRTKAIMPVHLFGHPADMAAIAECAKPYGSAIIEDAAQAHGASWHGRAVGAIGNVGCFSFYPVKNLGAFGDAGIVVTSDPQVAERVKLLADHGQTSKYVHSVEGYNYRLDALQAAVLNAKLPHLAAWNERRRAIARAYGEELGDLDLVLPIEEPHARHVYHQYAIRSTRRDDLREWLLSRGVQVAVHYPVPLHLQPAYASGGYKKGDFPVAEKVASQIMSLPMYPELTDEQVDYVIESVRAFYRG